MTTFNPTLLTEKSPITETKAQFFARKAIEYKKLWEYFKQTNNVIAREQSADMWHAFSFFSTEGEQKQWHYENGNGISRLQASISSQAYL